MIGYVLAGLALCIPLAFTGGWYYGGKGPREELRDFRATVEREGQVTEQLWLGRLNEETDRAARERAQAEEQQAAVERLLAGVQPAVPVRIPADVMGVWRAASTAANRTPASGVDRGAPPAVSEPAARAPVEVDSDELAKALAEGGRVFGLCSRKLQGCINRYNAIRDGTLREALE